MSKQQSEGREDSGVFLIVDGDVGARREFKEQVESAGHRVDVAASAAEAIDSTSRVSYDAVVAALEHDVETTVDLVRELQRAHPGLAVVLINGLRALELPDDQSLDRALVSVIAKPWDSEELFEALTRAKKITEARTGSVAPARRLGEIKLLLLEDSEDDAALFRFHVESSQLDVEVSEVPRLDAALRAIEEGEWDLVVADLSLPDARGLDAVRRLRGPNPQLPVLVVSGTNDEELVAESLELGAHGFLAKGELDAVTLARSLRHALARQRADAKMHDLASTDPLTGLANRASFEATLRHALARLHRTGSGAAVLFLDLDRFKAVNDTHGHDAGDEVLRETATRLRAAVREPDTLARLGGDEFVVLVEDAKALRDAWVVAERISAALNAPFTVDGHDVDVGCSIGIALAPEHGDASELLVERADQAMYQAKRHGGGRCGVFGAQV